MNALLSEKVLTVDEMTVKIREAVCSAKDLQNITVKGELLGFKRHTSGHAYFTVMGSEARVACVLFRSNASSVIVWPKDGDEVLVSGKIDIYGARGSYQIYATKLLPLGEGAKARAKEFLKNRLTQEGIFDIRNKRPMPVFPSKVAVITSLTGAAVQDVIKISSQRFPSSELIIIPSLMQGNGAAEEILAAFDCTRNIEGLSLVMLVRGGGSRDDLDVFDEEVVVRAVRSSPVPVITGLGHQIDMTLADIAADSFAPTPSGAAERVFPDSRDVLQYLRASQKHIFINMTNRIERLFDRSNAAFDRLLFNFMKCSFDPARNYIDNSESKLKDMIKYRLNKSQNRLDSLTAALNGASPLNILSNGYAIARKKDGETVKSASSLSPKDKISVQFIDGVVLASVSKVNMIPAVLEEVM